MVLSSRQPPISGAVDLSTVVLRDGTHPLTANWDVGAHKLTNVADPTAAQWGYLWRLLLLKRNGSHVLWRHHSRPGGHGRLRRHSLRAGSHGSLGVSLRCGLRPRCCSGLWGRSSVRLLQQRGFVLFLYRAILLSQLILLFCCGRRRRHRDGTVLGVRERSGHRTCGLRCRRDLVPPPLRGVLFESVHRLSRRRIRI